MDTGIIGAGVGGLTAAALLAHRGHTVSVYEKNGTPGGKMNRLAAQGYRFDTGPSLLTMPDLLRRIFTECGANPDEYLSLKQLDPVCRYFYPDGTVFDSYSDPAKSRAEIERIAPGDSQAYFDFLAYSQKLYERTADAFLFNPLHSFSDLQSLKLADFIKIDAFTSVSQRVDRYFQSPYLRRFFKRFSTYNGSSPYRAPATLNVIPHVELSMGGYYVEGGLYKIIQKLERLALEAGASFHFNKSVQSIEVKKNRVHNLHLDDGSIKTHEVIISNSDASETYLRLLGDKHISPIKRRQISRLEPSCSGFVMMLGVQKTYDQLHHHNIFFSNDYRREFEAIFQRLVPPEDPTIYIANTSHTDPGHAPPGCSNLFVLVNVPYLNAGINWSARQQQEYTDLIISKLEHKGLKGLGAHIEYSSVITPMDFYRLYRSNKGSIYGSSSNSPLSAFLRPGNKSRDIDGLYLAGGSTHPGGGIPLAILSAFHAVTLLERDYS